MSDFWHYTLLSFAPLALMSSVLWWSYFDRMDRHKEPLLLIIMAFIAGSLAALTVLTLGSLWIVLNFDLGLISTVMLEELVKVFFIVGAISLVGRQFDEPIDGIIYGLTVGLGFAFVENVIYLAQEFSSSGSVFLDSFWLTFQGRFWTATILHGLLGAIFGSFYASAYLLSDYFHTGNIKIISSAPWRFWRDIQNVANLVQRSVFLTLLRIIALHITRRHLIFHQEKTPNGHCAAEILLEGLWLVIIIHSIFNLALSFNLSYFAFALVLVLWWFVSERATRLCRLQQV